MTLLVFLSVLLAALLHAVWNALIKTRASKVTAMLVMTLIQGGLGLAVLPVFDMPPAHVWPWLIASGLFHSAYKLFLAFAYEQGDLSRVYPIARGAAPMIVTVISALALVDVLEAGEYLAIFVLGLGIALMAHGAFRNGESRRLVPLALGSAAMTAGYSLVDGLGARAWGQAVPYVAWLFVLDAILFAPILTALRGWGIWRAAPRDWLTGGLAAAASYGAYAIVVWAMTMAPIALVAALRETSILFAVLIGWLIMGDRMDRAKAAASALIVGGVVLTRL
ncbi:MAG: peptide ABC transporter permease [Rhodobacteraceae bacterium]|nr:MAG: peptide ABC transporter permease [Paracoccaceae bacterium]